MLLWFVLVVSYIVTVVIVAMPPLAIYTGDKAPTPSTAPVLPPPPTNDTRRLVELNASHFEASRDEADGFTETTPNERRFIYLLLMIPAGAAFNALVVYMFTYRHTRLLFYRMERQIARNHTALEKYEEVKTALSAAIGDGANSASGGSGGNGMLGASTVLARSFAQPLVARPTVLQKARQKVRPALADADDVCVPLCDEVRFTVAAGDKFLAEVERAREQLNDAAEALRDELRARQPSPDGRGSESGANPVDNRSVRSGGSIRLYSRPHPKPAVRRSASADRKTKSGPSSPRENGSFEHVWAAPVFLGQSTTSHPEDTPQLGFSAQSGTTDTEPLTVPRGRRRARPPAVRIADGYVSGNNSLDETPFATPVNELGGSTRAFGDAQRRVPY